MADFHQHGEGPVPMIGFEEREATAASAPGWVSWAVLGGIAIVAASFLADGGWSRPGLPYASWYWPDEAPGMQIAHGGSRWVLDTRQPAIAVKDSQMAQAGTFGGMVYFAPKGGGGGPADAVGPVYVRVGPDRYVPLVEGGPAPNELKRRTLEGAPIPLVPER